MQPVVAHPPNPLAFLDASDLKEVDDVPFAPTHDISPDLDHPYGSLTRAEYNQISRSAVKECVRIIEKGLMQGLNSMLIFRSMRNGVTALCAKLAEKAGVVHSANFALSREFFFLGHYRTFLGEGLRHPQAGKQLLHWLAQRPLSKEAVTFVENKGNETFLAQLYTPEERKKKEAIIRKKVIAQEMSDLDQVTLNILDSLIEMDYLIAGVDSDSEQEVPEQTYYVGRVLANIVADQKVLLSTYIVPVQLDGDKYKFGNQVMVLHPHATYLKAIELQIMFYFHQALHWDRAKNTVSLSHYLNKLTYYFGHEFGVNFCSDWCLEIIIRALYHFHHISVGEIHTIPLAWQAIITPFSSDFEKRYAKSIVENPITRILASSTETSKYMSFSLPQLIEKVKAYLAQRINLHNDCLQMLLFRFMQKSQKQKNINTDTKKLFSETLLGIEQSFHKRQKAEWERLRDLFQQAKDGTFIHKAAEILAGLRTILIQTHASNTITIVGPYTATKPCSRILNCRRIREPVPPMLNEGDLFQTLKQGVLDNFKSEKLRFSIDAISLTPLTNTVGLTPQEFSAYRQYYHKEYISESAINIYFERYVSPKEPQSSPKINERSFVYLPVITILNDQFTLAKAYSSSYEDIPLFVSFDKAQEHFTDMLDEEFMVISKIALLFAAVKYKWDNTPPPAKPAAAAVAKAPPRSYTELDALIYPTPAPKQKKIIVEPTNTKDESPAPEPILTPPPPPKPEPITIKTIGDIDYRVFRIIMGEDKSDITWKEVKKCLASLGFSIIPRGGKIYQFKYEKSLLIMQKEGITEYFERNSNFERSSKNFHEPHIKRKHTARSPLSSGIIARFKELLEKAGMNMKTVKTK